GRRNRGGARVLVTSGRPRSPPAGPGAPRRAAGPPRGGPAGGRDGGRPAAVAGQPSPRGGRESTIMLRAPTVSRVAALYSDSSGGPSGSAVPRGAVQRSPYALGGRRQPNGAQWLFGRSRH